MASEINSIKIKEAETKAEKLLLGLIDAEISHIDFGRMTLELTIQGGEIKTVQCVEVKNVYKLS